MPSYAAFLGHQPHISIAELASAIRGFSNPRVIVNAAVIFDAPEELSEHDLTMLGGTVTLARQLPDAVSSLNDVPEKLRKQLEGVKGKATFSLRCLGLTPREIHEQYKKCKDLLKKRSIASRYVGTDRVPAAAVLLRDEHLLDGKGGCELCIVRAKDLLWVGRTFAAQDIDAYVKRDMHKPVRDTTVGLLPPKLAQVLLNFGQWMAQEQWAGLSEKEQKQKAKLFTVFDPFCGTGVIPVECLLRGEHVIASDLSLKAVNGCSKNVEWARKEYDVAKKDVTSNVFKHDATKPFPLKEKERPNVIVTEGSLGPAMQDDRFTQKEISAAKTESEKLTIAFLENVRKSLPGVPVVMTWPVWYGRTGQIRLEKVRSILEKTGFMLVMPPGVRKTDAPNFSLTYRRANQFVGREIVLLRQKA